MWGWVGARGVTDALRRLVGPSHGSRGSQQTQVRNAAALPIPPAARSDRTGGSGVLRVARGLRGAEKAESAEGCSRGACVVLRVLAVGRGDDAERHVHVVCDLLRDENWSVRRAAVEVPHCLILDSVMTKSSPVDSSSGQQQCSIGQQQWRAAV